MAFGQNSASSLIQEKPSVQPSKLGRFVSLNSCPQWYQYEFDDEYKRERSREHDYKEAFRPLNLLLAKDGDEFEEEVFDTLDTHAHGFCDHSHIESWTDAQPALLDAFDAALELPKTTTPLLIAQARFGNRLEAWPVEGDADILACWRLPPDDPDNETDEPGLRLRVLDVKAAHDEKTYQQIQVACYTLLLRRFLENADVDFPYVIEGGIIVRDQEITGATPNQLPSFDLQNREVDVRRLLQESGSLDELHESAPEEVRYQLGPKCHDCGYREACFTDAVEASSSALLGLTRGDQVILAEHGVDTIEDLAELAYPPDNPRPYEFEGLTASDRDTYQALLDEPGIGEKLDDYIQEAQSYLGRIAPDNPFATDGNHPTWLLGSGDGRLPDDDPPFDLSQPIERGSMIRIYLNVQRDHRYDRLNAIGGYISATNAVDHGPVTFGHLADDVSQSMADADALEENVLEDALTDLFEGIETLGGVMESDYAPIHFYFFSNREYDALTEALARQEVSGVDPVRDLLGLRAAIHDDDDQAMVSIVQNDLRQRKALGIPTAGLLPALDICNADEDVLYRGDWSYTRSDGEQIDLREAFNFRIFDYMVPYERQESGLGMYADNRDGYYPTRPRLGASLPLEYVWAAHDVLTPTWTEETREEYDSYQSVEPFRWIDRDEQRVRITPEDIEQLVIRFAHGCAHIERSLRYKNTNLPKKSIRLHKIRDFTLDESDTARAAAEFLDLEYSTGRREQLQSYALPLKQRIRRGDAIPVIVESAWKNDDTGELHVDGRLPYDQMFDDDSRVAQSCRQKGAEGSTMGSWMVANRMTREAKPRDSSNPWNIEHAPRVTVENLDIENYEIHLTAFPSYTQDHEFTKRHRSWTVDPSEEGENTYLFAEQKLFILDPQTDDIVAQRSYDLLEYSDNNPLCQLIDGIADGRIRTPTTDSIPKPGIEEYLDWATEPGNLDYTPNDEQQKFIADCTTRLSLLQGPPGTGKTSGAVAHAALARVRGFVSADRGCVGLVGGESNKAVDEVLEEVHDALVSYRNHGNEPSDTGCDSLLDGLELVRLATDEPDEPLEHVTYLDYHGDHETLRRIVERIRETQSQPTLVFATPARMYKLIDNLDIALNESLSPEQWLDGNAAFFDFLAIDEASMMRLPSFLTTGAFLKDDAQVMVAGDQRQMPPVKKHEWEDERRRIIQERVPYLSALDYCRLLRGDSIESVEEDYCVIQGTADLPLYQLEQSYRCHTDVADFLQTHVYAQDGIQYNSEETKTVCPPEPASKGVGRILCDSDILAETGDDPHALSLIVHDEDGSRQSNIVEAAIGAAISQSTHEKDEMGIVTPHNAHRGLVNTYIEGVECDTVERYQGGQRSVILVSATASDPDFIEGESEFLLNPNRLNVAMSRMQRGLIVVASSQVFDVVPTDVEEYERAGLWKGLFNDLNVLGREGDWSGTLEQFVGNADLGGIDAPLNTDLTVYVSK
ncbi:AAA domain-containing protein [Halococcus sp. AFM35]|uniref:bifunctional RecB family nuclease/DEAD/DEAH box helicase n=1 Tax=Halococcus sp. AFM35 TaxID=3421653 RepID=UPI003EB7DC77